MMKKNESFSMICSNGCPPSGAVSIVFDLYCCGGGGCITIATNIIIIITIIQLLLLLWFAWFEFGLAWFDWHRQHHLDGKAEDCTLPIYNNNNNNNG